VYTISAINSVNYRERGSRFIGYLFPAESREQFDRRLDQLQSEHPDASHHCYAWRMNPSRLEEFSSDDGEPSGTAGIPILNQMKSFEVVNAGLVTVRYFGGTKLGKPGLIEAYGHTASLCLQRAKLVSVVAARNFRITYAYPLQNEIDRLLNICELKIIESTYLENVTMIVACPLEKVPSLQASFKSIEHLQAALEPLGESVITN
jgi:uncharacterized YigZ family protein